MTQRTWITFQFDKMIWATIVMGTMLGTVIKDKKYDVVTNLDREKPLKMI